MSVQNESRLEELTEEVLRAKGIMTSAQDILRARGISMSVEQLFELMVEQVSEMPEVEGQPSAGLPPQPVRGRLADAGISFEPYEGDEDPVAASIARYSELVASSLSTSEAAERLGVVGSRIRQLLTAKPPLIYGFKDSKGAWKIPRFQFAHDGLVPGLRAVVAALEPELHPLEVYTWFQTPTPDLTHDGDRQLSPLQWLKMGRDVEAVVAIAEKLV